ARRVPTRNWWTCSGAFSGSRRASRRESRTASRRTVRTRRAASASGVVAVRSAIHFPAVTPDLRGALRRRLAREGAPPAVAPAGPRHPVRRAVTAQRVRLAERAGPGREFNLEVEGVVAGELPAPFASVAGDDDVLHDGPQGVTPPGSDMPGAQIAVLSHGRAGGSTGYMEDGVGFGLALLQQADGLGGGADDHLDAAALALGEHLGHDR